MKRFRFAFALWVALASGRTAFAQEPTPATPPADTTRQQQQPVIQDSVRPIPQLATHYLGPAMGLSDGVWVWSQKDFLREATTTLGDLLDRIPGIWTVRTGLLLQPEAASAFGSTANRVEVVLDGYVLDPLTESSVDISKIELVNIESVRIERRIGLIRIQIETIMPADTRAYTRIEAGVGEPESNMFRGILLAPKLFLGPLGVAIDRMDTDGFSREEPADQFAGWLKWSYIRGKSGLQVEYRRMSTDRDPQIPWDSEHTRDDLIARLRINIREGLVADVFAGKSSFEQDTADLAEAEDTLPKINESTMQFGGRVSFVSPLFWARGSLRFRDNDALPSTQIDAAGGVRIGEIASVSAEVTQADWREAGGALWYSVSGQITPIAAVRAFAEYTGGSRGAPYVYGGLDSRTFVNEQSGYRAGAEVTWRGFTVGGALLNSKADSVPVFGLPFDDSTRVFTGHDANGWEISGTSPAWRGFSAFGHAVNWLDGVGIYMPTRLYRAGVQLHTTPLKSGNLEIFGRIEAVHRGSVLTHADILPADDYFDAYLQIRIIDVRLFGRFEDIMGSNHIDVPGREIIGPRIFYGVKWQFWN